MPLATLAAVVIVYSIGLIKPAEFRAILSVRRTEFIWAVVLFPGSFSWERSKVLSLGSSSLSSPRHIRSLIRPCTSSDQTGHQYLSPPLGREPRRRGFSGFADSPNRRPGLLRQCRPDCEQDEALDRPGQAQEALGGALQPRLRCSGQKRSCHALQRGRASVRTLRCGGYQGSSTASRRAENARP